MATDQPDLDVIGRPDYEHRWLINPQSGEIVFWTFGRYSRSPMSVLRNVTTVLMPICTVSPI
jgi:hypothetical protein